MLTWLTKVGHDKILTVLYVKMDKKNIIFGKAGIEKPKFYQHKNTILIYEVETNKVLLYKNVPLVKRVLNILLLTKKKKRLQRYE